MAQKRLRIFAGPNGSGKSTMLRSLPESVDLGIYINADDIEKEIPDKGIVLNKYNIKTDTQALHRFFERSDFVQNKSDADELKKTFSIAGNTLQSSSKKISPKYSAALIAEFLREQNLLNGNNFSFETVMSHESKLQFIKKANKHDYHVYLYFICTDDPRVNAERVKTRIIEGGHAVPENKIRERYFRTLDLLYDTLKVCYKSYLFDNSNKFIEVARVNRDNKVHLSLDALDLPNWFVKYVIHKSPGFKK